MTRTIVLAALALGACFDPTFDNPTCGPNGECPSGTSCSPVDNICREDVTGIDGAIDSPTDSAIDASIDSGVDSAIDGTQVDSAIDSSGPVCGDGVINGGETCDDRNGMACGTCTANCSNVVPPRAATGSIMAALGKEQLDGEIFVLDDGINPPVTFEWERNGGVPAPRVPVPFQSSFGQGQMAMAVASAINSVGSSLLITATHSGGPMAMLSHDRQTALGNRTITHTVTNGTFAVTGMSGGAAGDCGSNVGCTQNADCASGTCLMATQTCQ